MLSLTKGIGDKRQQNLRSIWPHLQEGEILYLKPWPDMNLGNTLIDYPSTRPMMKKTKKEKEIRDQQVMNCRGMSEEPTFHPLSLQYVKFPWIKGHCRRKLRLYLIKVTQPCTATAAERSHRVCFWWPQLREGGKKGHANITCPTLRQLYHGNTQQDTSQGQPTQKGGWRHEPLADWREAWLPALRRPVRRRNKAEHGLYGSVRPPAAKN